jgi:hypothetical protein
MELVKVVAEVKTVLLEMQAVPLVGLLVLLDQQMVLQAVWQMVITLVQEEAEVV